MSEDIKPPDTMEELRERLFPDEDWDIYAPLNEATSERLKKWQNDSLEVLFKRVEDAKTFKRMAEELDKNPTKEGLEELKEFRDKMLSDFEEGMDRVGGFSYNDEEQQ